MAGPNLREIYERLTGMNLLADRISTLKENQEKLNKIVVEHEGRLIRLETFVEIAKSSRQLPDNS